MAKYFPLTRTKVKVVEVPIGDGDRDISYPDSFDIADRLSGTLGPVQTPDTLDVNDELIAGPLVLGDTLAADDEINEIIGPQFKDSLDITDRLSGTIGPIAAPDTLDVADELAAGPLVLGDSLEAVDAFGDVQQLQITESVDISDRLAGNLGPVVAPDSADFADELADSSLTVAESVDVSDQADADLTARAPDSLSISDRLREIILFRNERTVMADAFAAVQQLQVDDSIAVSDQFAPITGLVFGDTLDIGTVADAMITARNPDSLNVSDVGVFGPITVPDSASISDLRGDASITNARLWPNAVVSNTGFTNPNNFIDLNEGTGATISVTQSGGFLGGNSATVNGNIQVSAGNLNINPTPSVTNAQVQAGWTTTASGGLQNGNSVNVAIEYSLNDGASWSLIQQVTTVAATGNPTVNITATYAQLQQLRFRAVGSVVSGTTALVGGANQTFTIRYARIQFNASQSL